MQIETSELSVTVKLPGFHQWPDAFGVRSYLGARHRHTFHITVTMPTPVDDQRQVEFHDLMDDVRDLWGDGERGGSSCETMAYDLASELARRHERPITVTVSEDGEAAATVKVRP
jgi:hypothetical protein